MTGQSKIRTVTIAFLLVLLTSLSGVALGESTDLYFENGVIYTVDGDNTIAEALAVKDGKIVFVGSAADGEAYKNEAASIVDLEGNMLMPGLIDSHIHSVVPSFFDFTLEDGMTLEGMLSYIRTYVEENPDQETYFGFGYYAFLFPGEEAERGPRKEWLDEICPDKPIALLSFDGHALWANSAYFALHGITYDTESPRGGAIEKDEEKGELWGTLNDSAIALGGKLDYDPGKAYAGLMEFQAGLNAYGYTGIVSLPGLGVISVPFDTYREMEENGELTIKVYGGVDVMDWSKERDLALVLEARERYNSPMVKMNTAKFFIDGVLDTRTAYLLEPYADVDSRGMVGWTAEDLQAAYAQLNEAGIQVHTHAIGDGAVRMALDALDYAKENAPAGDYRNAITHLQLVDESDIARFAELDIVAVVQPYWHYKAPNYWEEVELVAVGERAGREYPIKSFLDAGAMIASSSDYPVTMDPNPFFAMQFGVTRNLVSGSPDAAYYGIPRLTDMDDPAYLLWPEERVTIEDMIRSFTASGAYAAFADAETGTLEVNKAADMIIISQNLLEIDPLQIEDTVVLATYVNGELVYAAE